MELLLDTHALIWWVQDNPRLSTPARDAIADPANDVFVSAACAWEITIKHNLGKLPEVAALAADVQAVIAAEGFEGAAVTVAHAERAGRLPLHHRDPFDRMLIAQATADARMLVSNEVFFDRYGVQRLW